MSKKRKLTPEMEELVSQMPPMGDEELDAFIKEHGLEATEPEVETGEPEEGTPDADAPAAGETGTVGAEEPEGEPEKEPVDEEPDDEKGEQDKRVPYAALKEERSKRKSEQEKARGLEKQFEDMRKQQEEYQKQLQEMQKQLYEAAMANRQAQPKQQEQAPQEPDPLRDIVLEHVKPLIDPILEERKQREQVNQTMQQMRQNVAESEKRAKEKYDDYDERTQNIFAFAAQKAQQGDPSYAMDILSQRDPAEYAYNLAFRLEAQNPQKQAPLNTEVQDSTTKKIEAISKHPRTGLVPGGGGSGESNLVAKLEKMRTGELRWSELTKEEQERALKGKF